jgi:hypothetical protein
MQFLNDPRFWRRFAMFNIVLWTASLPVAEVTGWVHESAYISRLSELALLLSALSWWQSTRVEVKQHDDNDVAEVMAYLKRNLPERKSSTKNRTGD